MVNTRLIQYKMSTFFFNRDFPQIIRSTLQIQEKSVYKIIKEYNLYN